MKKIIHIFIFIILMIFSINKVEASNYVKLDYISGVYYIVNVGDYYYSYNEPIITINDNVVYCLEPEKSLSEKLEYSIGNINNLDITEEQLKKIELIGYYGYGFINHNSYKYYLATQELIWRTSRPDITMSWTTSQYGGNIISVEKEKEEIMFWVNNHYNVPIINNLTLTQNQEVFLNYDLSTFEILNSSQHEVAIEPGILRIKTQTDYIGKSIVELSKIKRPDKGETTIYTLNGYQSLIYPQNNDEITVSFEIDVKVGNITIKKVDSETLQNKGQGEATLEGTIYNLYDNDFNFIEEIVLDSNLTFTTRDLRLGDYYLKEKKSGKGYIIDENYYPVTISATNLYPTIILKNKVINSTLNIEKTYGDNYTPESDAIFSVIDKFGNTRLISTDSNGKASIELKYGSYLIKQLEGKHNHKFIEEFEVIINEETEEVINYKLHNEPIKTSLIINKLDKITGEKIITEAYFKIYDLQNNQYLSYNNSDIFTTINGSLKIDNVCLGKYIIEEIKPPYGYSKIENLEIELLNEQINENSEIIISVFDEFILGKVEIAKNGINYDGDKIKLSNVKFAIYAKDDIVINGIIYYKKDELIEEITTIDGIGISKYLPVGNYYILETETVKGYKKDSNIYNFQILDEEITKLEFINYYLTGNLKVTKIGINDIEKELLNNVKFGIYAKNDIVINDVTYYKKNELVEELITKEGQAISKSLPIGSYYIKEIETVSNYQLSDDIHHFEIIDGNIIEIELENYIKDDDFEIYDIPNTEVKTIKLNAISSIIIIMIGYLIIKYAKK